jgi:hypothetical protein
VNNGKDHQKQNKRRLLRTFLLFLASLLISTATASVYNLLYMQGMPISAASAKVVFAEGSDATAAGTSVGTNGTYVKFTSLSGWPNATRVYENATVIKNEDSAVNFGCELSRDSWSGSTGSVDELYVRIFNAAGTWQGTLDVVAGNTTSFTIPFGEVWRVEWRIKWSATALSTDSVTVTVELKVTGEGTGE